MDIARMLVQTGAVAFRTEPFFTFTSGTQSPVYVDNRRLLGYPAQRRRLVSAFVKEILRAAGLDHGGVAGTSTAGIPWAAWIADRLDLPMLYARSQAKEWGHQRAVEGAAPDGARVAVVEDLAFTGASLGSATRELRSAGYTVDLVLTIVSYNTPGAAQCVRDLRVNHETLTTIDLALLAAQDDGALNASQVETVEAWLANLRAPEARGL